MRRPRRCQSARRAPCAPSVSTTRSATARRTASGAARPPSSAVGSAGSALRRSLLRSSVAESRNNGAPLKRSIGNTMDELQTLNLPLLPLNSGVVLPGMVVTMAVESDDAGAALSAARNGDGRLILVPRFDNGRYASVGTVATVETAGELPSGLRAVVVRGLQRARVGAGVAGTGSALWVQVEPVDDPIPSDRANELAREYRAVVENVLEYRGAGQIAEALRGITDPGAMADTAGYSPDLSFEQKVEILEETDIDARLT